MPCPIALSRWQSSKYLAVFVRVPAVSSQLQEIGKKLTGNLRPNRYSTIAIDAYLACGKRKRPSGSRHKNLIKIAFISILQSCQTWFTHLETVLCTISLAAGFGNLYRLPQTTLLQGGLPFLVAYVVLTVLVGLPLLFLELGIGQLAQEGFIKSWRAVPFFKGQSHIYLRKVYMLPHTKITKTTKFKERKFKNFKIGYT